MAKTKTKSNRNTAPRGMNTDADFDLEGFEHLLAEVAGAAPSDLGEFGFGNDIMAATGAAEAGLGGPASNDLFNRYLLALLAAGGMGTEAMRDTAGNLFGKAKKATQRIASSRTGRLDPATEELVKTAVLGSLSAGPGAAEGLLGKAAGKGKRAAAWLTSKLKRGAPRGAAATSTGASTAAGAAPETLWGALGAAVKSPWFTVPTLLSGGYAVGRRGLDALDEAMGWGAYGEIARQEKQMGIERAATAQATREQQKFLMDLVQQRNQLTPEHVLALLEMSERSKTERAALMAQIAQQAFSTLNNAPRNQSLESIIGLMPR